MYDENEIQKHMKAKKKIYDKKRYTINKENIAEQKKTYYTNNKENIAEQRKTYYTDNKENIAEQRKTYYTKHKEEKAQKYSLKRDQMTMAEAISAFKADIIWGPIYPCVSCHMAHFRSSVTKTDTNILKEKDKFYMSIEECVLENEENKFLVKNSL